MRRYVAAVFPPIKPYASGMLHVRDGHRIYWECCGNPDGKPAVYLHGGPGSGSTAGARGFFDPSAYRFLLFDQRGSGRSRPLASEPGADLSANTTVHLIEDIEALRQHVGASRGGRCSASRGDRLSVSRTRRPIGSGWTALYLPPSRPRRGARSSGSPCRSSMRTQRWCSRPTPPYVSTRLASGVRGRTRTSRSRRGHRLNPRYADPEFRLRFTRLVTHFWRHSAFLEDGQLIRAAPLLDGIPGVLIHGRYDVSSPLETPWLLSRRWATSELHVVDEAGHGAGDAFGAAIVDAVGRLALS